MQNLDAQLKRQPLSDSELKQRVQALTQRVDALEAERAQWEDKATQLEEVAEAERAKVAQLKKRLDIAESGPDKLTKREINFWRGRAEQFDKDIAEYKTRLATLRRELMESDALVERLRAAAAPSDSPQTDVSAAQIDDYAGDAATTAVTVIAPADDAAAVAALAAAEAAALDAQNEAQRLRTMLTERDHRLVELTAETEQIRHQAQQWLQQVEALRHQAEERDDRGEASAAALEERDARIAALEHDLGEARTAHESAAAELGQIRAALETTRSELEQARAALRASDNELSSLRNTLSATAREREQWLAEKNRFERDAGELRDELDRLRSELDDVAEARRTLEQERTTLQTQFAELETELKDEREHAANMSELANERRERITKLEEQVEEANERYEEAKWRLGKAQHFERLVRRRKGLILKLLAALRAKMKANRALKAGLDGLRRFKAASEANQHKLLARLETLKNELHEARDALDRQDGSAESARVRTELAEARARTTELEERIATQVEIIETLESDLKLARAAQRSSDEKTIEIERLRKEMEQRDTLIAALQTESEEHQRKLGKLRGSESETTRLRAISEQDRATIEALEREVAKLKTELAGEGVSERKAAR